MASSKFILPNIRNSCLLFDELNQIKCMQRCDIISTRNNQLDSSVSVHLLRNQTCDSTITLNIFYKVYTLPPSTAVVLELREQEEKPQHNNKLQSATYL